MVDWNTKTKVELAIENIAINSTSKYFYPIDVSTLTGYSIVKIWDILMSFVDDKRLILKFEIRCKNHKCGRVIKKISSPKDKIINRESIKCICGESTKIEVKNLFPVFSFSNKYREYVIAKNNNCSLI